MLEWRCPPFKRDSNNKQINPHSLPDSILDDACDLITATLILITARHGLRVSEAIDLEWDQIDFTRAHLHVRRLKGGIMSVHPIQGDELRALRRLSHEHDRLAADQPR
jgi:integrase